MASWSAALPSPDNLGAKPRQAQPVLQRQHEPAVPAESIGLIHQLNWDVKTQSLTQHRIAGYYNAQCCGFSAEYQFIDLTRIATAAVPQDSRFHFSVTLGGIGNVSNIFGAMSGMPEANSERSRLLVLGSMF